MKTVEQEMAESRSPDPVGQVFKNHLGVIVELLWEDDFFVNLLRLRKDGRRMKGRKETTQMGRERFKRIYRPMCPDQGTCHHECGAGECFRVHNAGPLSEYGEDWTDEDRAKYKDGGHI